MERLVNKIFCFFNAHRYKEISSDTRMCVDCFNKQKRVLNQWINYKK